MQYNSRITFYHVISRRCLDGIHYTVIKSGLNFLRSIVENLVIFSGAGVMNVTMAASCLKIGTVEVGYFGPFTSVNDGPLPIRVRAIATVKSTDIYVMDAGKPRTYFKRRPCISINAGRMRTIVVSIERSRRMLFRAAPGSRCPVMECVKSATK